LVSMEERHAVVAAGGFVVRLRDELLHLVGVVRQRHREVVAEHEQLVA
jgi:hypothetical protein